MKPIVLATDGSETAEAATLQAIELASVTEAPLVVVTAWEVPYNQFGPYGAVPVASDLNRVELEQAERVNAAAVAQARAAGVEAEPAMRRGFPAEEICRVAEEHDAGMIVVGTHGWGPVRRIVFGSISTGVLHRAPCPVLVVPPAVEAAAGESAERKSEAVAV